MPGDRLPRPGASPDPGAGGGGGHRGEAGGGEGEEEEGEEAIPEQVPRLPPGAEVAKEIPMEVPAGTRWGEAAGAGRRASDPATAWQLDVSEWSLRLPAEQHEATALPMALPE